jgi:hypothetical protein
MYLHKFLAVAFLAVGFHTSLATHLRSGQIFIHYDGQGRQVTITIRVFTNMVNTSVLFGGEEDVLRFGDGSTMLVPERPNTVRLDLGPNGSVAMAEFTTTHTYASNGYYIVSYLEPNRNADVLNFDNSVTTPFYIESAFMLDPVIGPYHTAEPLFDPIFLGYPDQDFSCSVASADPDGSELRYVLRVPLSEQGTPVINYKLPENFEIDPMNGLVTWDNKFNGSYVQGEYLFGLRVDQFRKINGEFRKIGYAYRDFQIILSEELSINGMISDDLGDLSVDVHPGESETFKVFISHAATEDVEVQIKSELPASHFSYEIYDSLSGENYFKVAILDFKIDESVARNQPYIVTIRGAFQKGDKKYLRDKNYEVYTQEFEPLPDYVMAVETTVNRHFFAPNPVSDFFTLNTVTGVTRGTTIEINDLQGRRVMQRRAGDEKLHDISGLSPGVYVIRLTDSYGNLIASGKLVKE